MQQIITLLTAKTGTENNGGGGGVVGGRCNNNGGNNNSGNNPNNTRSKGRKVSTTPNIRYKFYCWSHGVNPAHNSCTCPNKFPGHQNAAIYTNQMNGWQTNATQWCGFVTPWIVGRSESKIVNESNIIVPIKTYTPPSSRTNLSSTTQPWITVTSNKDRSLPPTSRTATTTSPSILVATANQFSSFMSRFRIHHQHCTNEVELNNEVLTPNGPCAISATKNIIQAKARGELRLPNLPTKTTVAHKMPVAHNLL